MVVFLAYDVITVSYLVPSSSALSFVSPVPELPADKLCALGYSSELVPGSSDTTREMQLKPER
jgi:hypothetical protein